MLLLLFLSGLYYVDQPYFSTPYHGEFGVELRFGPGGEILGYFTVGVWDRLQFGVSYGASNLIGAGDPQFYDIPGVQLRIVAIEQGYVMPHVLFGFDNQGYGAYDDTRYDIMSKGLYCQIGRIFAAPSIECAPSIGANYCLEDDGRFDMFCGVKTFFGTGAAFAIDYSPNINDDQDQNKGYLNISLQFIFYEELFFELALRDLLDNSLDDLQFNRMIRMGFSQVF
jgi:hypothetical protein